MLDYKVDNKDTVQIYISNNWRVPRNKGDTIIQNYRPFSYQRAIYKGLKGPPFKP